MQRDFYLTLPSNTDGETNKTNSYRVNLPIQFSLQGEWEVALSEISYPHSWSNVKNRENYFRLNGPKHRNHYYIPEKKYSSPDELVEALNHATSGDGVDISTLYEDITVKFYYKRAKNRIMVSVDKWGYSLELSKKLQYILGYDASVVITGEHYDSINYSEHPPDLTGGFTSLFVYCDLIAPQIVGNVNAQVVRVVNIEAKEFGQNVDMQYSNPHYVPVLKKDFSSIEIDIKDDRGQLVPFEFGKVCVKLHFRRTIRG